MRHCIWNRFGELGGNCEQLCAPAISFFWRELDGFNLVSFAPISEASSLFCFAALTLITVMASDDLNNPSSDLDNPSSSSSAIPSQSLESSCLTASSPESSTDNRGCPSRPTTLKLPRNSLDPLGSPTDSPPLPEPPFTPPTAHSNSIHCANSIHDNDSGGHGGSCSLYRPSHPQCRRRNGRIGTVSSIGSSSTERDAEGNSSPLHSAHSGMTSTLPTRSTHLHTTSDAGDSRLSFATSIVERIMEYFKRPSLSPSREMDTGSDTTRNDGQRGNNARPAENGSPRLLGLLPSEFKDSSRLGPVGRLSPPLINESPPFSPTPNNPILAEPQRTQSRVSVGSKRSSTHSGFQT